MSDLEHAEDSGGTELRNWKGILLEHSMWFLSRLLLIVALIVVAYEVKIPLEKALQKSLASEIELREKDDALKKVDLRKALLARVDEVEARIRDVATRLRLIRTRGDCAKATDFTEFLNRLKDAAIRLKQRYARREVSLDDGEDEFDFDVSLMKLVALLDEELPQIPSTGRTEIELSATKELIRRYRSVMRERDSLLNKSRKRSINPTYCSGGVGVSCCVLA